MYTPPCTVVHLVSHLAQCVEVLGGGGQHQRVEMDGAPVVKVDHEVQAGLVSGPHQVAALLQGRAQHVGVSRPAETVLSRGQLKIKASGDLKNDPSITKFLR